MFTVKLKVKEGHNSLPRSAFRTDQQRSSSPSTLSGSLRSSLVSSNRSPYNSLKRKDKRVRIITTHTNDHNNRAKTYGKDDTEHTTLSEI